APSRTSAKLIWRDPTASRTFFSRRNAYAAKREYDLAIGWQKRKRQELVHRSSFVCLGRFATAQLPKAILRGWYAIRPTYLNLTCRRSITASEFTLGTGAVSFHSRDDAAWLPRGLLRVI